MSILVAILFFAMVYFCSGASYYNGVNDGFGFAKEPWNPGYRRAGEWIKKYTSYKWPETHDEVKKDEEDHKES